MFIFRIWDNHKLLLKSAQKTLLLTPKSQYLKRKTQSFLSSLKRSLVVVVFHLRNNSLIMTEKCSDSSLPVEIFNSNGIIS